MALIRTINRTGSAGYGINVLEVVPPPTVQGVGTSIVAVVGHFPWGPVDTPTVIGGAAELFETFCPLEFGVTNDYASMKAFISKRFPSTLLVVRLDPDSGAAATKTFNDGVDDSVVVTARYPGAVGSQIRITFADNADTATNSDMTVKVLDSAGTVRYERTYLNAIVGGTPITISAEAAEDPFVITTVAAGDPDDIPAAVADSALTAGSDGTPVIGDWTAALDTLEDGSNAWNVVFGAEVPDSLVDGWNDAMKLFADDISGSRFCVMSTPGSEAVADALSAVDTGQTSDRCMRLWRKARIVNTYDPARGTITVDPNSFAAVAIASVDPWISPGGAGGREYLRAIAGVEPGVTATDAQLESLRAAGITPLVVDRALGAILRSARTTDTSTVDSARVFVRRMRDFLAESLSNLLLLYAERPLDIDIANRRLGPVTAPEIGSIRQFLDDLASPDGPQGQAIRSYELDEFGGNTQANIDDGQWIIILRVKLISMQEEIVLRLEAGTTVEIEEV